MTEATADADLRRFAAERRYSDALTARWLQLPTDDAAALLELGRELRPSQHQLMDLWEWAEEIAGRDGMALAEVLSAPDIIAARRQHHGRNDRLRLVMQALRRRRFPQLAAVENRLAECIRALALPRATSVRLPANLEGSTVTIEIEAGSVEQLRVAAAALLRAADTPACAEIFRLLDEAP